MTLLQHEEEESLSNKFLTFSPVLIREASTSPHS